MGTNGRDRLDRPVVVAGTIGVTAVGLACSSPTEPALRFFDVIPDRVDHNVVYRAAVVPHEPGVVTVPLRPDWLSFDEPSSTLEGLPGWENRGTHVVILRNTTSDGPVEDTVQITVDTGPVDCSQMFGAPEDSPYIMPIPVGVTSQVTQSYCRTGSGGHHNTYAYDFALNMGDTVVAARGGLVYRVQESYTDGNGIPGRENFIYVEHDDGTVARYVHLMHQGALVNVGQTVHAGHAVGLNGLTGGTSRPHLHFEVFRDRTFNDSTPDFAKRFSLPVNFRNADGPLDARGGLIEGESYTAVMPQEPSARGTVW